MNHNLNPSLSALSPGCFSSQSDLDPHLSEAAEAHACLVNSFGHVQMTQWATAIVHWWVVRLPFLLTAHCCKLNPMTGTFKMISLSPSCSQGSPRAAERFRCMGYCISRYPHRMAIHPQAIDQGVGGLLLAVAAAYLQICLAPL
jgi:hypothetical protein